MEVKDKNTKEEPQRSEQKPDAKPIVEEKSRQSLGPGIYYEELD